MPSKNRGLEKYVAVITDNNNVVQVKYILLMLKERLNASI
jgi:hypothetical protein